MIDCEFPEPSVMEVKVPSVTHTGERGENRVIPGAERSGAGETPGERRAKAGEKLGEIAYRSPEYPVDALGPLAEVCKAIANGAQVNAAMVGQSLLGAAALITQGAYEVESLSGYKPLSEFFLTIADSGDGKSTAEDVALYEIRQIEKERYNQYVLDKDANECEDAREPYLIASDSTVQGVIQGFRTGWPSQGVFTAEGATMLCGWGMRAEHRANTSANLNRLWDGLPVSVQRGNGGRTQLYRRRFSAHWLIQPDAAQEALFDQSLSSIGLWPRFLISWPEPLQPRKYKKYRYWEDLAVKQYWERCRELLSCDILGEGGECKEFTTLFLSDDARKTLEKLFERMEQARNFASPLHPIKPFAVRACEHVCRIAGILAAFEGNDAITDSDVKNAIKLVSYSLDTWRGIFGKREDSEHAKWACDLHAWMLKRPNCKATETAIIKTATPKYLRNKDKRDTALAILQGHQLVRRSGEHLPNGDFRLIPNEWEALPDVA